MNIRLVQVPYDSGHKDRRMGRGPQYLIENGLIDHLESLSASVQLSCIEAEDDFPMENQTTFELFRKVATEVASAERRNEFPIVLSGNCDIAVGSVSGLSPGRVGIIWFDAHSDFRTPSRSYDGFLDAMGLAILNGLCWEGAAATVSGFRPLPANRLLHVGGRLLKEELHWLNQAGVGFVSAPEIHERTVDGTLMPCLEEMARHVDLIDLHLDLDVIDPAVASANTYAREKGLTFEQISRCFELILDRLDVGVLDVTAYDPTCDSEGRVPSLAFDLIERVVAAVAAER